MSRSMLRAPVLAACCVAGLSFATADVDKIREGVARLGQAI